MTVLVRVLVDAVLLCSYVGKGRPPASPALTTAGSCGCRTAAAKVVELGGCC